MASNLLMFRCMSAVFLASITVVLVTAGGAHAAEPIAFNGVERASAGQTRIEIRNSWLSQCGQRLVFENARQVNASKIEVTVKTVSAQSGMCTCKSGRYEFRLYAGRANSKVNVLDSATALQIGSIDGRRTLHLRVISIPSSAFEYLIYYDC